MSWHCTVTFVKRSSFRLGVPSKMHKPFISEVQRVRPVCRVGNVTKQLLWWGQFAAGVDVSQSVGGAESEEEADERSKRRLAEGCLNTRDCGEGRTPGPWMTPTML
jgi:hypothetical protein